MRPVQEKFHALTFDVAGLKVLGVDLGAQRSADGVYFVAWKDALEYAYWRVILVSGQWSLCVCVCSLFRCRRLRIRSTLALSIASLCGCRCQ